MSQLLLLRELPSNSSSKINTQGSSRHIQIVVSQYTVRNVSTKLSDWQNVFKQKEKIIAKKILMCLIPICLLYCIALGLCGKFTYIPRIIHMNMKNLLTKKIFMGNFWLFILFSWKYKKSDCHPLTNCQPGWQSPSPYLGAILNDISTIHLRSFNVY